MPKDDLERALGRALVDKEFLRKWLVTPKDLEQELLKQGYHFSPQEFDGEVTYSKLQRIVQIVSPDLSSEVQYAAAERTWNLLQDNIEKARGAYQRIKDISTAIFIVGISLFALAGSTGIVFREAIFAATFGGLGVVTFASVFFSRPVTDIQNAVSNLVQIQVAFINFYNQLFFWTRLGMSDNLEQKREASRALNEVMEKVVTLLQL